MLAPFVFQFLVEEVLKKPGLLEQLQGVLVRDAWALGRTLNDFIDSRARGWIRKNVEREPFLFEVSPPFNEIESRPAQVISPSMVILVSDHTGGYFESCGCSINPSGGATRRNAQVLKIASELPEAVVRIDLGTMYGEQAQDQSATDARAERRLVRDLFAVAGYDVVVPTWVDVIRAGASLRRWETESGGPTPIAANLVPRGPGPSPFEPYRILERQGTKVIIIGLSGPSWRHYDHLGAAGTKLQELVKLTPSIQAVQVALQAAQDELDGESSVVIVAGEIAHVLAERLAKGIPEIDLILSSNTATLRPAESTEAALPEGKELRSVTNRVHRVLFGRTWGVFCSAESFGFHRVDLELGEGGTLHWAELVVQQVPNTLEPHDESTRLVDAYYSSVVTKQSWGLHPLFPGRGAQTGGYVGATSCQGCHAEIFADWRSSKHANAFDTLLAVRREYVPKCLRCHVVGLGEEGGYSEVDQLHLRDVGCEVCHGGGADHLRNPRMGTILRGAVADCDRCHDGDHSPEFGTDRGRFLDSVRHW
jgi:Cytochrome c554 and c-prime